MSANLRSIEQRWAETITVIGLVFVSGCGQQPPAWNTSSGVIIQQSTDAGITEQIRTASAAVPSKAMKNTGLAGANGGAHVKLLRRGSHDVRLPIPQIVDSQIPVWYGISTTPEEALIEYRLQDRGDGTVFVNLKLNGAQNQEIKIEWSSVILFSSKTVIQNQTLPEPYVHASPCVQSGDKQIDTLATKLWPASGKKDEYAKNIQEYIRTSKQREQPRSLDALGILESGLNGICTANANLACALMRARQIPCRSIAVIPPISRKLEMHRIVEYFENGTWISFDPSLVQADVPMKSWQNIIVAKTSTADEEVAMKPRMGVMPGCPFGQELELSGFGVNFSGNDFFWTIATPLADFEVGDEAVKLTETAWRKFLKTGKVSAAQIAAASARSPEKYIEAMKRK